MKGDLNKSRQGLTIGPSVICNDVIRKFHVRTSEPSVLGRPAFHPHTPQLK